MLDKNAKIYVAGHQGLVGSAIWKNLEEKGYTNLIGKTHKNSICSTELPYAASSTRTARICIPCRRLCGWHHGQQYLPCRLYLQELADTAERHRRKLPPRSEKILFLGSTCIYPCDAEQPMKEDAFLTSPLEYTNEPYAIAKIAGLKMCESFNLQYGTNYIAVMPTNLYGPNDNFDLERSHVLPAMIRKIHLAHCLKQGDWDAVRHDMNLRPVEGINGDSSKEDILNILRKYGISEEEVRLWGTGTPLREFLWSEEMADASVFVMEHVDFKDTFKPGDKEIRNCHINIGTGKEITIRQLAELIVNTVGYQGG